MNANSCGRAGCVLAAVVALLGCRERNEIFDESADVSGPHIIGKHLVFVQKTAGLVTFVDSSSDQTPRTVAFPFPIRAIAQTTERLLVSTGSLEEPKLVALDSNGEQMSADLPAAFDRLLVQEEWGVATFESDALSLEGVFARNNNEVGIINLKDLSVVSVSLNTESHSPTDVHFSEDEKRIAIALESAVVLLSPEDPESRIHIPLVLPDGTPLTPEQMVFSVNGDFLYIRASGLADVLAIDLGTGFSASINFLAPAQVDRLHRLYVPKTETNRSQVLALFSRASGGSTFALLDGDGDVSLTRSVSTDKELTHAFETPDGYFVFFESEGMDGTGDPGLVAWDPALGRLDETRLAGKLLAPPVRTSSAALFVHDSDSGPVVSSVTITQGGTRLRLRKNPLVLAGSYSGSAVSEEGRPVFTLTVPRKDSGAALDYDDSEDSDTGAVVLVEPSTLSLVGVALDAPVQSVGFVGDRIYATHEGAAGDLSLIHIADPRRETMRRMDGYLLNGLLESEVSK